MRCNRWLLYLVLTGAFPALSQAARIGEIEQTDMWDQALRFWSFQDPSVVIVVAGTLMLGICCGLMGSFIVVRKMSLVGDTLSHAVLPGVAAGFLWNQTNNVLAMMIGAVISGLLAMLLVNAITRTTHIKEDSALGIVLACFYAIGICMKSMIQRVPSGDKMGMDNYLIGQAAALAEEDVILIGVIAVVALVLVISLFKELKLTSFDPGFSKAIGIPYTILEYALYALLTFAIVVSLKAAGVVLVSALLIIPPACAYLLTDNFGKMITLSVLIGMVSAVAGGFFSFLGSGLPTGPLMVASAATLFAVAFFFGPRYGWVPRLLKRQKRAVRIRDENLLRSIYLVRERSDFAHPHVTLGDLAKHRNEDVDHQAAGIQSLVGRGLAFFDPNQPERQRVMVSDRRLLLTAEGALRSCQLVRNHRLWELYLTHVADYASDHVHDDAERVEHLLGEDTVRQLEKRLNHPRTDPHGKLIPSIADMEQLYTTQGAAEGSSFRQDY